ncbi:NitT/TauT family transport system permease protein [Paraburkholderia sp. CI2]|uniref:ABC transporter permease n=1 Tax=Paraburkholderia sp. CI2 TaxID=2723093 RepID=UPI0016142F0A|nr:ABC transporter permease [Paraburkholderia sp. CI2]MBB5470827.1 NitT/TauT family transport system permease protein [Paraburkholderia sp. CI2]
MKPGHLRGVAHPDIEPVGVNRESGSAARTLRQRKMVGEPGRAVAQRNVPLWTLNAAGLIAFFGIWWLASAAELVPAIFLPTPLAVVHKFADLLTHPFVGYTLEVHLWSSLQRYLMGFLLAVALGVPLGLTMGWFRWLDYCVTPLFETVRFIAPIAWVPFAALWFGTGIGGPVLIIFAGAFPPCVVNAYRGAQQVDGRLLEAARMLGASNRMIVCEVLLPGALPSVIAGVRVAAGLGWMSLVGAELIVASSGIGYMMVKGQAAIDTATVMSAMIAIGMVGAAIDLLLGRIEAYAMRNRRVARH